jgi:hypothetical protein
MFPRPLGKGLDGTQIPPSTLPRHRKHHPTVFYHHQSSDEVLRGILYQSGTINQKVPAAGGLDSFAGSTFSAVGKSLSLRHRSQSAAAADLPFQLRTLVSPNRLRCNILHQLICSYCIRLSEKKSQCSTTAVLGVDSRRLELNRPLRNVDDVKRLQPKRQ